MSTNQSNTFQPNKTAAITNGGITALLCGLILAKKNWSVQVYSFQEPGEDVPLVLLPVFVRQLKQHVPEIYELLVAQNIPSFTVDSLLAEHFGISHCKDSKSEETRFFSCRSSILHRCLINLASKNTLIEMSKSAFDYEKSQAFDLIFQSQPEQTKNYSHVVGGEYTALVKYFCMSEDCKARFQLFSKNKIQGGLYPQDQNWIAVVFILKKKDISENDKQDSNSLFQKLIIEHKLLTHQIIVRQRPLQVFDKLINAYKFTEYGNKLSVGGAHMRSNPIYGHNLALTTEHLCKAISMVPDGTSDRKINYLALFISLKVQEIRGYGRWLFRASMDSTVSNKNYLKKYINEFYENDIDVRRQLIKFHLLIDCPIYLFNPFLYLKILISKKNRDSNK